MSREMNRRAVLARTAAAFPAAALASVPALASSSGELSFPDLAVRFDVLYARWRDWSNKSHASSKLFDERFQAATGLSREEWPKPGEPGFDDFQIVWKKIWDELPHKPVDKAGEDIEWAAIFDELWPLAEEILLYEAESIADLSVQARAMAYRFAHCWTDDLFSDDPGGWCVRMFVDSVCALAGIEALPGLAAVRPLTEEGAAS